MMSDPWWLGAGSGHVPADWAIAPAPAAKVARSAARVMHVVQFLLAAPQVP